MRTLRIGAVAAAMLGAGGWDAAFPATLCVLGLLVIGVGVVLSQVIRRRRRVLRLMARRSARLQSRPVRAVDDPAFAAAAQTLADLATPPVVATPWTVEPHADGTGAEIIYLDRFRGPVADGEAAAAPALPEAVEIVEMQRRLVERVAGLRSRRLPGAPALSDAPIVELQAGKGGETP